MINCKGALPNMVTRCSCVRNPRQACVLPLMPACTHLQPSRHCSKPDCSTDPHGWYQRMDNNGWRPLSDRLLQVSVWPCPWLRCTTGFREGADQLSLMLAKLIGHQPNSVSKSMSPCMLPSGRM